MLINFQVKSNAPLGVTHLNLAADIFGSGGTNMSDENFNGYTPNPPPQDNVTSLSPYTYIGTASTDQDDSTITIAGTNQPPVAGNDAYSVTARSAANNRQPERGRQRSANADLQRQPQWRPVHADIWRPNFRADQLQHDGQHAAKQYPDRVGRFVKHRHRQRGGERRQRHVRHRHLPGQAGRKPLATMTAGNSLQGSYTPQVTVATTTNGDAGVLDNDSSPIGNPITAVQESSPTDGTLSFNANGSFTYTPNINFVGTDSFTYVADDTTVAGSAGHSNTATVTLTVTARLSIPTNLTGVAGRDSGCAGQHGRSQSGWFGRPCRRGLGDRLQSECLHGHSVDVNLGTLTNNTNAVQTITFGGGHRRLFHAGLRRQHYQPHQSTAPRRRPCKATFKRR